METQKCMNPLLLPKVHHLVSNTNDGFDIMNVLFKFSIKWYYYSMLIVSTDSEIHSNSKPQVVPGFKHRRDLLRPHNASPTLSFKSGTLSSGQMSPASFIQTGAPPNTMIDSCLGGKEEPIKQTLLKALSGLNN